MKIECMDCGAQADAILPTKKRCDSCAKAHKRERMRAYYRTPERQTQIDQYNSRPEVITRKKTRMMDYNRRPEVKVRRRDYDVVYQQSPKAKLRRQAYWRTPKMVEFNALRYKDRRDHGIDSLRQRDGDLCSWCGEELPPTPVGIEVDHLIPVCLHSHIDLGKGNLQLLHEECNRSKGAKIQMFWRAA